MIASAQHSAQRQFLTTLTDDQLLALPYLFDFWAMPHQTPPQGDWRTWMILGGRGAGKTRAGAEWVRSMVEGPTPSAPGKARRVALIGETMDQAREVMVFGDSGLLAVCPPDRRPDWIAGRKMLVWPNGAQAQVYSAFDPDSLRGPQFDAAWADETGCPAVDKGANQPDRALGAGTTPQLPIASSGARDDLMQMQYLRAMHLHFAQADHNPVSDVYGAAMLDMKRIHVWGWDARPYPFWPGNRTVWSDGAAYGQGHWLNGRASSRSLASVVAEICARSGVTDYDTSALFGVVRGYTVADAGSGRAALQPLMLAYGFDVVERDGMLVFQSRRGVVDHHIEDALLAFDPEAGQSISRTRAAGTEVTSRVQLAFLHADADYAAIAEEAALPDDISLGTARSEVPLVLTRAEGQATVARWLQEARAARETARFALPPSRIGVGAGDVVAIASDDGTSQFRIDRIEDAGLRLIEATQIAQGAYVAPPMVDEVVAMQPHVGPAPAELLFLDLPMISGDEQPHAPRIASAGRPWPGSIAVYGAPQDSDYALEDLLNDAATVGTTRSALSRGPVGTWDRQTALEVELVDGALTSATVEAVLAGSNMLAIGDGSPDGWEVLQFQTATPLYTRGYALSGLLRGQFGTWGAMPDLWPAGSHVVLLDAAPRQINLPAAARGTERHIRYGPAQQPITDTSYRYATHAFAGNGLRPYPVTHLRGVETAAGLDLSWIRCSRIDGDLWADGDIPLGEDAEAYRVRVTQGGALRREDVVSSPTWHYTAADIAAETGGASYQVAVAQVSARYGAGPFVSVTQGV